ncbi:MULTISPECIES: ExbD/TolR family protein [Thiomicrorhabdus]|uniref:Biopolymer transporter ExbD n=1 Tax=Thiomicrorhabdus heinhorstiae TaxID=2748010 RepID=A0ABS0BW69_9GAMM|nr:MULTISPECIES: biopolymer transporter ExbD [Thiomicrorhabdus]MBF6058057.1 biopolymer transporter ExbD [Thiomicrorhabdus heinhorstiae]
MHSTLEFKSRKKRIGLTALIDVVFIILMFFMLSSSFVRWTEFPIEIDTTNESAASSQISDEAFLYLQSDGSLNRFPDSWSWQHFTAFRKEDSLSFDRQQTVQLKVDPQCELQTILQAMEFLRLQGLSQIRLGGMATDES